MFAASRPAAADEAALLEAEGGGFGAGTGRGNGKRPRAGEDAPRREKLRNTDTVAAQVLNPYGSSATRGKKRKCSRSDSVNRESPMLSHVVRAREPQGRE